MIPDFSTPDAMRRLLSRAVQNVGKESSTRRPRWSHVGSLFVHGSGYSIEICRTFGVDPDEMVGGLDDGMYCPGCGYCQGCLHHFHEEHGEDCELAVARQRPGASPANTGDGTGCGSRD